MLHDNKELRIYSRNLRQSQTIAEMKLWSRLKNRQFLGYKFRRQTIIQEYIVDFFCNELNLIIEIDGSSHDDKKYEYDLTREEHLKSLGYNILRFTEFEVKSRIDDVLQTIENFVDKI